MLKPPLRNTSRMDATDWAIVEELRRDGRLSNVELSARVGLTPAPCLRRVRRLEADGVIAGYHAHIDPRATGRGFEVLVSVELERKDRDSATAFERSASAFPEVLELRKMFGLPDYVMRVGTADLDAYERFATDKLTAIPGIAKVDSHLTMKVVKHERPTETGPTAGMAVGGAR